MKKVPEKFKGCGIRVQCLKCRAEVTDTCLQKGKSIATCENKEKHKFKLVVHIPNTSCGKRTRLINSENFDSALIELTKFKQELQNNNFELTARKSEHAIVIEDSNNSLPVVVPVETEKVEVLQNIPRTEIQPVLIQNNIQIIESPTQITAPLQIPPAKYSLVDYIAQYLDFISGINTPFHLLRKLSPDHIKEIERVVERFCASLQKANYDVESLDLTSIGQNEVGIFCSYIVSELKISSYNKHCAIMKSFFNWCIQIKDCDIKNPFIKMRLSVAPKKDKTAISQEEFRALLDAITFENGQSILPNGKKINYYHEWLPIAFRLALETGLRAEEVVTLKFNNICELNKGVKAFKLVNLKVWRIQTGEDQSQINKYVKYVPITSSLNNLLLECGYLSHKGEDKFIIPFPSEFKLSYVQDIISRSFTHYIKLVSDRKVEYKDLRKTYITAITMALGDKAKLFTGHSDDAVIQKHYLADSVLMGGLTNLNIFDNCA